jgi:citrate lyase gamma subunit
MPESPEASNAAKIEYDRLIAYFDKLVKYSLLAITVIVGLAGGLLWKNTDEVKTQAAAAIETTQRSTTTQIAEIKTTAEATAKSEAEKAINAAFEKQSVQRLIESTAQRKVDAAVEVAVKRDLGAKVDAFRSFVIEIGEINNHGAQLRLDFRSGLDYLLKARQSADPAVRTYASSTLSLIAADYEYEVAHFPIPLEAAIATTSVPVQFSPKQLMELIRTAQDPRGPTKVAVGFATMKSKVGWDVPMFDIPAAEKWCAEHKAKCDQ